MGYDGYDQCICANHHRFDRGWLDDGMHGGDPVLCECGADAIWTNAVDQTNGPDIGYIPDDEWSKLLICRDTTDDDFSIYRIPTEDEQEDMQYYDTYENGRFVPHKMR